MTEPSLKVVVRTPRETILEIAVKSLRVPTESGHVGLRPSVEGHVLAIEAGIANLRVSDGALRFIGTAGGLLLCDGDTATLLTPLAVVGDNEQEIVAELDRALTQPSAELEARTTLSRLEGEIVSELQHERLERVRPREAH